MFVLNEWPLLGFLIFLIGFLVFMWGALKALLEGEDASGRCENEWHWAMFKMEPECPACARTWEGRCTNDWHKAESILEPECPSCGGYWKSGPPGMTAPSGG
jgi:hypothetical protein